MATKKGLVTAVKRPHSVRPNNLRFSDSDLNSDGTIPNDLLSINKYAPTTANVANTTTLTPFIIQAFDADEWKDGEVVEITTVTTMKNGSIADNHVTIRLHFGAQSVQINPQTTRLGSPTARTCVTTVKMLRCDTVLHVVPAQAENDGTGQDHWDAQARTASVQLAGCDFSVAADLKLSAECNEASVDNFITVLGARILKY